MARSWVPTAALTLVAGLFAWLNRGERVVLDLGVVRMYRIPLSLVGFAAFLAGMLAMLILTLRHDLRVREALRDRGLLERPRGEPRPVAASAWGLPRAASPPVEVEHRTPAPRYDEDPVA
jgi:hypothetical protein